MPRLAGEEGVERADADDAGLLSAQRTRQIREIGEVSDPPIMRAPEAVELAGEAPTPRSLAERRRQMAGGGGDGKGQLRLSPTGRDIEAVIAERQRRRQRQRDTTAIPWRSIECARAFAALLETQNPPDPAAVAGRQQGERRRLRLGGDDLERRQAERPGTPLFFDIR